jgi:hypothetical protein
MYSLKGIILGIRKTLDIVTIVSRNVVFRCRENTLDFVW